MGFLFIKNKFKTNVFSFFVIFLLFLIFFHNSYSQEITNQSDLVEVTESVPEETEIITEEIFQDEEIEGPTQTEQEIYEEVHEEINKFIEESKKFDFLDKSKLKERVYTKNVVVDKNAVHSCESSSYVINISYVSSVTAQISINREELIGDSSIEIGGLPFGIDVKITPSSDYLYKLPQTETSVLFSVEKEQGAQKGSFNIPIFFNIKTNEGIISTSVCQINIVNLP